MLLVVGEDMGERVLSMEYLKERINVLCGLLSLAIPLQEYH
jgi:hypothetical protein